MDVEFTYQFLLLKVLYFPNLTLSYVSYFIMYTTIQVVVQNLTFFFFFYTQHHDKEEIKERRIRKTDTETWNSF